MSIKCKIGLHSWDGCKCTECSITRDEQHEWDDCKCSKCGKTNNDLHTWNGCICTKCGIIRDEQHVWSKKDCGTCLKCGEIFDRNHIWIGCKCKKCGKIRDENHLWKKDDCGICRKCGKRDYSNHKWEGCKCIKCGIVRDENHLWDDKNCGLCIKCGKIDIYKHSWVDTKCKVCGIDKGAECFNALQQNIKNPKWTDRDNLINKLGEIKYEPAFETIIELLRHPNPTIRVIAADVLGWYDDIRALEPLLVALLDEDQFVMDYARKSIYKFGDKSFLQLMSVIENEDYHPQIRGSIISMNPVSHDDRFFQSVCKALSSNQWHVRMVASRVLADGDYTDPNFIILDMLEEALQMEKNNFLIEDMMKSLNRFRKRNGMEQRGSPWLRC